MGEIRDIAKHNRFRHVDARSGATEEGVSVTIPQMLTTVTDEAYSRSPREVERILDQYQSDIIKGFPENVAVRNAIIRARKL